MPGFSGVIRRIKSSGALDKIAKMLERMGYPEDVEDPRDYMWNALKMAEGPGKPGDLYAAMSPDEKELLGLMLMNERGDFRTIESLGAWPQGHGTGTALMEQATKRPGQMRLMSPRRNVEWYEKFGFDETPDQDPGEDYFEMIKKYASGGLVPYDDVYEALADAHNQYYPEGKFPFEYLRNQLHNESSCHPGEMCNPNVKSPAGALGLLQMMPETFKRVVEKGWYKPRKDWPKWKNDLYAGVGYHRAIYDSFPEYENNPDQRINATIMGYNMGPNGVNDVLQGYKRAPKETRNYLKKVRSK